MKASHPLISNNILYIIKTIKMVEKMSNDILLRNFDVSNVKPIITSITNKTVVLDLDSTLVYTSNNINDLEKVYTDSNLTNRIFKLDIIDISEKNEIKLEFWGIFRPYLSEFITFLITYFKEIYVYSAGIYKYVHLITDIIFKKHPIKPKLILSREDCVYFKDDFIKPLNNIFKRDENSNQLNTFIIDDNPISFSRNKENGILISPYEPNISELNNVDNALLYLICWFSLSEVVNSYNIKLLNKNNIFNISFDYYIENMDKNVLSIYKENLNKFNDISYINNVIN